MNELQLKQKIFSKLARAGVKTKNLKLKYIDGIYELYTGYDNSDFDEGEKGEQAIQEFINDYDLEVSA